MAGVAGGRGGRGGGVLPGTFSQIPLLFSSLPWFSATLLLPVPHSLKGKHNTTNKPFSHGGGGGGARVCVPVCSLASTREPWTKVDFVASPPCSYSFIVQRKAMSQGWEMIAEATWVGHWRQWRGCQPSGFQSFLCRLTRPKCKHTSGDENHIVGLRDDTNYSCHVSSVFPLEDHRMKWM